MEKAQNMFMEKLEVFGILKESLKIPYNNPKFILLTFLTSLPLIFVMILHEVVLQTTMIQTKTFLTAPASRYSGVVLSAESDYGSNNFSDHGSFNITEFALSDYGSNNFSDYSSNNFSGYGSFNITDNVPYSDDESYYSYYFSEYPFSIRLFRKMSSKVFQLVFLYFLPLHLLDLINTITTVNSASAIYADEKPISINDMLYRPMEEKGFKGPLITSLFVLSLNSVVLFGLMWAVTNSMWAVTNSIIPSLDTIYLLIYGILSIALLMKWIEWSALWNMAIVFSVLEERHGLEALGISGYFSRGNKRCGLYLMLIFFVWRAALRLLCVYVGGHEKWVALATTSVLSCSGNVMKWVVCTVYFYDCKKRILEKKVDVENGRRVNNAKMVS